MVFLFFIKENTEIVLASVTFRPGRGDPLATSTMSVSCYIQELKYNKVRSCWHDHRLTELTIGIGQRSAILQKPFSNFNVCIKYN